MIDNPPNPFFSWQSDANSGAAVTLDPSLLISRVAGTTNSIFGYTGTDDMPPCNVGNCYYIVK